MWKISGEEAAADVDGTGAAMSGRDGIDVEGRFTAEDAAEGVLLRLRRHGKNARAWEREGGVV